MDNRNNDITYPVLPLNNQSKTKKYQAMSTGLNQADTIEPPAEVILSLKDILNESDLKNYTSDQLATEIIKKFNHGIRSSVFVEKDYLRGNRIPKGHFLLALKNNRPQLYGPSEFPVATNMWMWLTKIDNKGLINQNDLFYGENGSYVLNIPKGHYAKTMSGQIPKIYGEGTHVIHDPLFQFDRINGLVSILQNHIQHQTINIVRVPPGCVAKIFLNNTPYVLFGSDNPYVFNNATFQLVEIVAQSLDYICHSNIHILRVPSGKIAKIQIGSETSLLESQTEPYVINNPLFKLIKNTNNQNFFDATSPIIINGAKKRLIPHTGEVAVTYDGGVLKIIEPSKNNQPIEINNQNHEFCQMLNVAIETWTFPSEEMKKKKREADPKASSDEIHYIAALTKDNVKVGVQVLVTFSISNPVIALTELLSYQSILSHIENLATTDMTQAIQSSPLANITSSNYNQPKLLEKKLEENQKDPLFSDAPFLEFQDKIRQKLANELKDYGIKITRLNVERLKILNEHIQASMQEQSIASAKANTEAANLQIQHQIVKQTAEREATAKNIVVKQQNDALEAISQANLRAAENNANAKLIEARAAAQAAIIHAEGQAKAKEKEAEALANAKLKQVDADKQNIEMLGKAYKENHDLVAIELEKIKKDAITGFKGTIYIPGLNPLAANMVNASPLTFFGGSIPNFPVVSAIEDHHELKHIHGNVGQK